MTKPQYWEASIIFTGTAEFAQEILEKMEYLACEEGHGPDKHCPTIMTALQETFPDDDEK